MKRNGSFRCLAVALCCALVTLPQISQATQPAATRPATNLVQDVALHEGGTLYGQLFDSTGQRPVGVTVVIMRDNEIVAETVTDEDGRFTASELRGGLYSIAVGPEGGMFRLWAPDTAPPAAKPYASLLADSEVIRANRQCEPTGCRSLLTSPWLWGGVAAAAVAIPLALSRPRS